MNKKTKKKAGPKNRLSETSNSPMPELRLLDMLIDRFIQKLGQNGFEPKLQDVLRAIQLKQKLAKTGQAEEIFWGLIDGIREDEMRKKRASAAKSGSVKIKE